MKTGSKLVFIADDGSEHPTLDLATQRSVLVKLMDMVQMSNTDHRVRNVLDNLAEHWFELHGALLAINKERCEIANEHGL